MTKPTLISMFSGGGGMALGFIESGFELLMAADIEPAAEASHRLNWPKTPFICKDIRSISLSEIETAIRGRSVDVIVGGPPCQGFTNMGDKLAGDPRNSLFESYARLVEHLKPKCVLMENVVGLRTMYGGRYFEKACNTFARLGYNVYSETLNANEFGVPQKRKRLFVFGTRSEGGFSFPKISIGNVGNLKARATVGQAIMDLVGKENKVPNHAPLVHSDIVTQRYHLIPEGGKLPSPDKLPRAIRRKNFGNTYTRLSRKEPASTMVPGNNAFPVHPTLPRSLTPREAARIQSFPDKHVFTGTRARQCILVGNAVPPLLAANLAQKIKKHLGGRLEAACSPLVSKHSTLAIVSGRKSSARSMTFVDLFCGSGGFTRGFIDAGMDPVVTVDFDSHVESAHIINFPEVPYVNGDLSEKNVLDKVKATLGNRKLDVLVGGPPCQGFSIFGSRRFVNTRGYDPRDDKRNRLVQIYWDYVRELQPDWVIMENVPGFVSLADGKYLAEVTRTARKLGYTKIDWRILNAADYGVPQQRKRFVLIANKTGNIIPWPKQKYHSDPEDWQKPYRSVEEVFTDLAEPGAHARFKCHDVPKHNPVVVERFKYIKEGCKLVPADLPAHLRNGIKTRKPMASFSHVFKRLDRKKPSMTIVPGHNAFPVHPWLNRTLTIREAARLQTFPDDHIFVGPIIKQGLQAGNAFPCLLAQVLAERIIRTSRNDWTEKSITTLARYSMIR